MSESNKTTKKSINNLGKTLLIVNPVAQSGKGKTAGKQAYDLLSKEFRQQVDLVYTKNKNHATELAANSSTYDTLISLGGDGLVHEVVIGLMSLPKEQRPVFGVIPIGSGNDYARSLGIKLNCKEAVNQLMKAYVSPVDVGLCNDKYYIETLSFGLDAGIALGTMEIRKKNNHKGFILYAESGIDQIKNHFGSFNFKATLNPGTPQEQKISNESYIMAIQIGPTYGSGFKITPNAKIDDGKFDICYTKGKMSRAKALITFFSAKNAHHVNSDNFGFATASRILLEIDREVPCQMDGEKYINTKFDIKTLPKEINVYRISK